MPLLTAIRALTVGPASVIGAAATISAGFAHACALTPSGAAHCWGYNNYGQATDQPGPDLVVASASATDLKVTTTNTAKPVAVDDAYDVEYGTPIVVSAGMRAKPMELVFLLPIGTNRYFRLLANYIDYAEEQLADLNVRTTDVYFTYPEELRHSKRIAVFRDWPYLYDGSLDRKSVV